jgi:hypothetical protein
LDCGLFYADRSSNRTRPAPLRKGRIEDMARWNLFKMESADAGRARSMRYGFQRLGSEIVIRMQMRMYL